MKYNNLLLKIRRKLPYVIVHLLLILMGVVMVLPFAWMLATSFKTPREVLSYPPQWFGTRVREFARNVFSAGLCWKLLILLLIGAEILLLKKWESSEIYTEERRKFYRSGKNILILLGILFLFHICWSIGIENWKGLFYNYIEAWRIQSFTRYFFNSFFIAVTTTTLQLLTSALAAFAFAYLRFPGRNLIFMLFLGTMMIPHQALLVPNYLILAKLGWVNSYLALIVPFMASAFGIFLLRQFFLTMPRDLYDAAVIDGCSRLGFFFRILLPLSVAPLTTLGIFTFIGSWNSFLWPLIVTHEDKLRTIQVGLAAFNDAEGTSFELLMAASTFCILPLIIGFFFAQKQFIEGISRSGMKE